MFGNWGSGVQGTVAGRLKAVDIYTYIPIHQNVAASNTAHQNLVPTLCGGGALWGGVPLYGAPCGIALGTLGSGGVPVQKAL